MKVLISPTLPEAGFLPRVSFLFSSHRYWPWLASPWIDVLQDQAADDVVEMRSIFISIPFPRGSHVVHLRHWRLLTRWHLGVGDPWCAQVFYRLFGSSQLGFHGCGKLSEGEDNLYGRSCCTPVAWRPLRILVQRYQDMLQLVSRSLSGGYSFTVLVTAPPSSQFAWNTNVLRIYGFPLGSLVGYLNGERGRTKLILNMFIPSGHQTFQLHFADFTEQMFA